MLASNSGTLYIVLWLLLTPQIDHFYKFLLAWCIFRPHLKGWILDFKFVHDHRVVGVLQWPKLLNWEVMQSCGRRNQSIHEFWDISTAKLALNHRWSLNLSFIHAWNCCLSMSDINHTCGLSGHGICGGYWFDQRHNLFEAHIDNHLNNVSHVVLRQSRWHQQKHWKVFEVLCF